MTLDYERPPEPPEPPPKSASAAYLAAQLAMLLAAWIASRHWEKAAAMGSLVPLMFGALGFAAIVSWGMALIRYHDGLAQSEADRRARRK